MFRYSITVFIQIIKTQFATAKLILDALLVSKPLVDLLPTFMFGITIINEQTKMWTTVENRLS